MYVYLRGGIAVEASVHVLPVLVTSGNTEDEILVGSDLHDGDYVGGS